ncbi:MAG: hypothetical protein ACREBC_27030 [Pyrinomonadaceae bacterium]
MHKEKAWVLERISACDSLHKNKWYEHLNSIDLTRPGADTELKNLLEEVERERILWGDFELPGLPEWLKSHSGAQNLLSSAERWLLPKPQSTEGRPSLNPVELRLKQKEEDWARERKLKESALVLIVSSLGSLISTRNLYESTRSQL